MGSKPMSTNCANAIRSRIRDLTTCHQPMPWFLYLIECNDDSIYTGIAVDVEARYQKHLDGTGARYTRSRPPRRLLASFELTDRSSASKAEYRVKQLNATQKRALAEGRLAWPMPGDIPDETSGETPAADTLNQADIV
jgi:putative endonuclease